MNYLENICRTSFIYLKTKKKDQNFTNLALPAFQQESCNYSPSHSIIESPIMILLLGQDIFSNHFFIGLEQILTDSLRFLHIISGFYLREVITGFFMEMCSTQAVIFSCLTGTITPGLLSLVLSMFLLIMTYSCDDIRIVVLGHLYRLYLSFNISCGYASPLINTCRNWCCEEDGQHNV